MTVSQLNKSFPIKDFGLVGWAEVQTHYAKYEHLFGFELLEEIMKRGGFTQAEWIALQSNSEEKVKTAFNWYAHALLCKSTPIIKPRRKKDMNSDSRAAPVLTEDLNLKVIERIEKFGSGMWELLHKEVSEAKGWTETTKVMEIEGLGALVKITSVKDGPNGGPALSNSVIFIAGASVVRSTDNNNLVIGRHLALLSPVFTGRKAPKKAARVAKKPRAAKAAPAKAAKKAKPGKKSAPAKAKKGGGRPKGSKNR
jgi:hypothetical protein